MTRLVSILIARLPTFSFLSPSFPSFALVCQAVKSDKSYSEPVPPA